jgi:hypothetical protein
MRRRDARTWEAERGAGQEEDGGDDGKRRGAGGEESALGGHGWVAAWVRESRTVEQTTDNMSYSEPFSRVQMGTSAIRFKINQKKYFYVSKNSGKMGM